MKRIAIPVVNKKLSEFFGECEQYEIFDVERKIERKHSVEIPSGIAISELPQWLEKQGVTDVITYKVNPKIIRLFASCKVNLYIGCTSANPENLIDDYLQGKLESDEEVIKSIINSEI